MSSNIKAPVNATHAHIGTAQQAESLSATNAAQLATSRVNTAGSAQNSPDPQVKATRRYTPRRSYEKSYKERILAAYNACNTASERGELLRREGLYHSRICMWKQEQNKGTLSGSKHKNKNQPRIDHLMRENEHLKKKLAQAEAIIDLQKKVSELLGTHILPHEKSEVRS